MGREYVIVREGREPRADDPFTDLDEALAEACDDEQVWGRDVGEWERVR